MNCQIWDLERRGHCQVSSECLGSYLYCYKLKIEEKKVILCRRWSTGICYVNDHRNLLQPLLLDFLNVFNADGTASPGAERARLFPGWAFSWDYQRLTGKEENRSGTMPKYFQ